MLPTTFRAFEFTAVPIPRFEVTVSVVVFMIEEMFARFTKMFVVEIEFETKIFPRTFRAFEFTAVPIPTFEVIVRDCMFAIPNMFADVATIFVVEREFEA
jgi:hypothetical protein